MPRYDIVVVGAGNAGMSAALQCQLAGMKTLLIEQHKQPARRCRDQHRPRPL